LLKLIFGKNGTGKMAHVITAQVEKLKTSSAKTSTATYETTLVPKIRNFRI